MYELTKINSRNMKKLIFSLVCLLCSMQTIFANTTYSDLRESIVEWQSNGTPRKTISHILRVNDRTLQSFLERPNATSPTVLKAYRRYNAEQEQKQREEQPSVVRNLAEEMEEVVDELTLIKQQVCENPYAPSKIKKVKTEDLPLATIVIASRGHQNDKDAKGIFYDHYVLQRSTQHPTVISIIPEKEYPFSDLTTYVRQNPYRIEKGTDIDGKMFPDIHIPGQEGTGLLVIPGRMRAQEYDEDRASHEKHLIREALKRGQPILALCAGAWRLWDSCRQLEAYPSYEQEIDEGLQTTEGHVYSRMMRLSQRTGDIVYNIDMHKVDIDPQSLLSRVVTNKKLDVNSVHWKVVDQAKKPKNLLISAVSVTQDEGIKVPRLGTVFSKAGEAEAFENVDGAPILGIQWHPEAYNPSDSRSDSHLNILKFMAKAGDAYRLKRSLIYELDQLFG